MVSTWTANWCRSCHTALLFIFSERLTVGQSYRLGGEDDALALSTPRCCCFLGKCDVRVELGDDVLEEEGKNASQTFCCKAHDSKCNEEFPIDAGTNVPQLDAACKVDCSWKDCGVHGRAITEKIIGTIYQRCDCECNPGWQPPACDTELEELPWYTPMWCEWVPPSMWPMVRWFGMKYTAGALAGGPYRNCQIARVALNFKPVSPNQLLSETEIIYMQDMLRPSGALGPLNAIAHCALRLILAGNECPLAGKSLLLEHRENIDGIEWIDKVANSFTPMDEWHVANLARDEYAEESELLSFSRGLTVFELLYELFHRDPEVQSYSVDKHNCCDFARAVAELLLLPADLPQFEAHLQDRHKLNDALNTVVGEWRANGSKTIIRFVAASQGRTPNFEWLDADAVARYNVLMGRD